MKPTLWLIGDSTVNLGQQHGKGWGELIDEHFDLGRLHVDNRAIGARSSRTFRSEGRWAEVLELARPGDYVIIQFGHNDRNKPDDPDRPRGTLRTAGDEFVDIIHPQTGAPERVYSFGWYMRAYVTEALSAGLIPIVCSPVPLAPRPGEPLDEVLGVFAEITGIVAEQEGVAFIDLHGMITERYIGLERAQPRVVKQRYFVKIEDDYTHTNDAGAAFNAGYVVRGIRELTDAQPAARLKGYLRSAN
ncbi:MAG: lysophospholipase [Phycisphaeraceae bacterium]|nr:MAG: lysophospholipase [Phycisphaeraceae bacterium]